MIYVFVDILLEEIFLYLCRNSHTECSCKIFVNLMAYLSSDGSVNMKLISVWQIYNNVKEFFLDVLTILFYGWFLYLRSWSLVG